MIQTWRVVERDADAIGARPLESHETSVRVTGPLSDDGHRAVAALMGTRSEVQLWLDEGTEDVESLRLHPGLQKLAVTSLALRSWDGVRHVADSLTELHMGDTLRPISIAPMRALRSLTALGLHGPVRDVEALADLAGIRELQLRSVTLPDLSLLLPMTRLRTLFVGLGPAVDLSLLPRFVELEELELWRIRGVGDLSIVGGLPTVRALRLQSMPAVAALPSLRSAVELRTLALDAMKGITDLAPIADAPRLEELLLVDMPQLDPDSLRPLVGHPTLRRGIWGFGSRKKNAAAHALLPLDAPRVGSG